MINFVSSSDLLAQFLTAKIFLLVLTVGNTDFLKKAFYFFLGLILIALQKKGLCVQFRCIIWTKLCHSLQLCVRLIYLANNYIVSAAITLTMESKAITCISTAKSCSLCVLRAWYVHSLTLLFMYMVVIVFDPSWLYNEGWRISTFWILYLVIDV